MSQAASPLGRLELIAFLSGAVVMVLEITGSRVMAPFLGTSVFVWTTLIGVIMASLSAGYWWGGRLADRDPSFARLAGILFLACLFAAATAVTQNAFLHWLQSAGFELRLSALVATLALFAPASTMLGMVTPYVVRLKLTAIEHSGADVGRLYAISTAGSIVGTFACGYFLLSWMGSSRILYGLAALLLALSFIAAVDFRVGHRVGAAIFLLLAAGLAEFKSRQQSVAGFLDIDTAYQRLQVIDTHEEHTGRPVRLLKAEEANTQSAIYLDGNQLLSGYLRYFELIRQADRPLRRVLMIGSAGGVYPMHLARQMPALRIDVVEIDPEVTAIASRYFGLQQSARLRVFHEDGRTYVNRAARQSPGVYDAIYIDAFQTRVPPFQLLTREFAANLQALLSPQGIVALNFIASPSAGSAGLAPAVLRTFAAALPAVALYRVDPQVPQDEVQNLVLLASKIPLSFGATNSGDASRPLPVEADYRRDSSLLLTDDFAPVEYLVSDP